MHPNDQFNPKSRQHRYCMHCHGKTEHAEVLFHLLCDKQDHNHYIADHMCTTCGLAAESFLFLPMSQRTKHVLITSDRPAHERKPNDIDLPFGSR